MRCEGKNIECFNILQNLVMCNNSVTQCLSSRGPRVVLNVSSISADSVKQDTIFPPHLFLFTPLTGKPQLLYRMLTLTSRTILQLKLVSLSFLSEIQI
jgi:hypothetical protein